MSKEAIVGGLSNIKGLITTNVAWNKDFCFIEDDDLKVDTEKWNPITFAIYTWNLPLIWHLLDNTKSLVKKSITLPSCTLSEEKQLIFPLLYAFEGDHEEMFLYFLNTHYIIWKDDLLLNLIQTMFRSKQEMNILIRYLGHVMNSEILIASFHQMSFHYRSQFIQNLINLIEVVTEEKNMYYSAILDHLVKQPFSFYFLIVFIEQFY